MGLLGPKNTPLDAIPDLSDTQVIIYTEWPGEEPRPGRGPDHLSDHLDLTGRPEGAGGPGFLISGQFLYLCHLRRRDRHLLGPKPDFGIPSGGKEQTSRRCQSALGPDATSLGWGFSYAVVDETGKHDLAQLRSLQDGI